MERYFNDDDFFQAEGGEEAQQRKITDNCLVMCVRKMFKKAYPIYPKTCWTPEGCWLRTTIGCACILHCIFVIFSIAAVGFPSMIINLVLAAWSYSIYLTLVDWQLFVYFTLLVAATLTGFLYGLEQKKDDLQKIGLIVLCTLYVFNVYFIGQAYYSYNKTGGRGGKKPNKADEGDAMMEEA